MKTHYVGVRANIIASVMAGVMTFGLAGGPGIVAIANAQPKKPAATPAAPKKPAAGKPGAAAGGTGKEGDAELKRARDAYAAGETKFKAGDYAGALTEFQTADGIKPSPQAARYIGLCQDNLGKYPEAMSAYERFLANVPPKLQKERDEITKRVEQIKAMPGRIHVVTTPPGAAIGVDGKPSNAIAPTDVELAPGTHTLHITADGYNAQDKDIDVTYAMRQELRVDLEKAAEPPPPPPVATVPPPTEPAPVTPPPVSTEPRSKLPAYITGGLAVAAAGVGTAFGIMALGSRSDFDKNPTTAKADEGENQALIADMAFGVAITLGVTSIVLFLSGDDTGGTKAQIKSPATIATRGPAGPKLSVAPIVSPSGGGAGALLRF